MKKIGRPSEGAALYNEDLKTRFLIEKIDSGSKVREFTTAFHTISKYEKKYNTDIARMSAEDLKDTLESFVGSRNASADTRVQLIREYVSWCLENNIPNANDNISKVEITGLEKARKTWVASPLHLNKYLNEVFEPTEEKTVSVVYRAYLWLAYAGVKEKDVYSFKASDVDINERCINYNGAKLYIAKEGWESVKLAKELTAFNYNHPLYSNAIVRSRYNSDELLRGIKSNCNPQTIKSKINKSYSAACGELGGARCCPLNYDNVWLSGWFYRIYELERADMVGDNPFKELAEVMMEDVEYNISETNTYSVIRTNKIIYYRNAYNRWKLAFQC